MSKDGFRRRCLWHIYRSYLSICLTKPHKTVTKVDYLTDIWAGSLLPPTTLKADRALHIWCTVQHFNLSPSFVAFHCVLIHQVSKLNVHSNTADFINTDWFSYGKSQFKVNSEHTLLLKFEKTCVCICKCTQKNIPINSFHMFRQQENLLHLRDMLHNLFYLPQNAIYYIIFILSVQITIMPFTNHVLKFKYPPQ